MFFQVIAGLGIMMLVFVALPLACVGLFTLLDRGSVASQRNPEGLTASTQDDGWEYYSRPCRSTTGGTVHCRHRGQRVETRAANGRYYEDIPPGRWRYL